MPTTPQPETLLSLKPGEAAIIDTFQLPEQIKQLLVRFGFITGAEVRFSRPAPLGDPLLYTIEGSDVALRADTARRILITKRIAPKDRESR